MTIRFDEKGQRVWREWLAAHDARVKVWESWIRDETTKADFDNALKREEEATVALRENELS